MGNTAVQPSYLKHKPVILLKCFIKTSIKICFVICFQLLVQLVVQPDIDVSGHLQNVDTEMWDAL